MKEIYLIRHGATKENKARQIMGKLDPPLGEEEKKLIVQAGEVSFNPDLIFSSPLKRASMTAALLFPDREIILDSNLMERSFGNFEGKPIEIIGTNEKGEYIYAHKDETTLVKNCGEPLVEIENRINSFLNRLQGEEGKIIAVISHGSLISLLVKVLLGEKRPRASIKNLNAVHFYLEADGKASSLKYDENLIMLSS